MNKLNLALLTGVLTVGGIAFSNFSTPTAPSEVKVEYKNSCNYVSWKDNSYNEEGFILWRMDNDGEWEITNAGLKKNWYYFNDCNINPNMTYTYAITSFNRAGASSFSNQVSTLNNTAPSFGGKQYDLAPVTNVSSNGGQVLRDYANSDENIINNKVIISNNGTKVTINGDSNQTALNGISSFTAVSRANGTSLTWRSQSNPNYFEIYRNTNGNWIKVADVNGNYRSFFDNGCQDGVSQYAIRAWNGVKLSDVNSRKYGNWVYAKYFKTENLAPVVNTSSSANYAHITPINTYPNYNNGNISNFGAKISSSEINYSVVVLSWNFDGNNPDTYFVLERKTEGNNFEPIANVEFYQNQNYYTHKTTISYNTNYTYRLRAYTNGKYSNSLTTTIYRQQIAPDPITTPIPTPDTINVKPSNPTCGSQGCNKCNGQEDCLPDFYIGKCHYDEAKDLLYVDVCNGGSDYDFGYYNKNNFLYYYNNLANQTYNLGFKNSFNGGSCQTQSFKVGTSYVKTNMSGPFQIKIQLDNGNYIQETNERNNEFVYTIR